MKGKRNNKIKLSKKELDELKIAKSKPIVYDDESPKLSKKVLKEFKHYSLINHNKRVKDTISVRVNKNTKEKLMSLGKGYTSIVSRLIEYAFENPQIIKKCL